MNVIHSFDEKNYKEKGLRYVHFLFLIALFVVLGVFSGFFIFKLTKNQSNNINKIVENKKTTGIKDEKTFKDKAEGILREGGIDGEGSFHLERPGGKSQNVYLTSTTVDLSLYVGKKVRVWGKTFSGEKAGWLMDVGLIEIIK